MTNEQAVEILKAKLACIEMMSIDGCDNDCDNCQYLYMQGKTCEMKEALQIAISSIRTL